MKLKENKRKKGLPSLDMGLGREESKSRVVALVSNMVISELIHEFGVGYHLYLHPQSKWKIGT